MRRMQVLLSFVSFVYIKIAFVPIWSALLQILQLPPGCSSVLLSPSKGSIAS